MGNQPICWWWIQIALIPDDGWKAETCSQIVLYDVAVQEIVIMEPNNNIKIVSHTVTLQYYVFNETLFSLALSFSVDVCAHRRLEDWFWLLNFVILMFQNSRHKCTFITNKCVFVMFRLLVKMFLSP